MKFITVIFLFFTQFAFATKHYFATGGNNANSGLTSSLPKQTLAQLNIDIASYASGDTVLFNRGDVFFGGVIVKQNNLFFDAYGTGAKPLISGYINATSWTNQGGGIWYCYPAGIKNDLFNVAIDGNLQRLGRYPNADAANGGFLTYENLNGATPAIIDSQLSTTPNNWAGAIAVIRKNRWTFDTCRITAHSGMSLSYTQPINIFGAPSIQPGIVKFGYFIEDDIRTLDQFGEFFVDKSTQRLSQYFGAGNPSSYTIQTSVVDTGFNCGGGGSGYAAKSGITVQNIAFTGFNRLGFFAQDASNIVVKNCSLYNVNRAMFLWNIAGSQIDNVSVNHTISAGIVQQLSSGTATVTNNTVKNIALFAGMGCSGDGANSAIDLSGPVTCQYNRVDSVAYHGIVFQGSNIYIRNNYITKWCMVQDDGGAIYNYADVAEVTRLVQQNICDGGVGNPYGTDNGSNEYTYGIYIDGAGVKVRMFNNCVVNSPVGVLLNEASDIMWQFGLIANCAKGYVIQRFPGAALARRDTIINSTFFNTESDLFYWNGSLHVPSTVSIQTDMRNIFPLIGSCKWSSIATKPFHWWYHTTADVGFVNGTPMDLAGWDTFIGMTTGQVVGKTSYTVVYNATKNNVTENFATRQKVDQYGDPYNDSLLLYPSAFYLLSDNGLSPTAPVYKAVRRFKK